MRAAQLNGLCTPAKPMTRMAKPSSPYTKLEKISYPNHTSYLLASLATKKLLC